MKRFLVALTAMAFMSTTTFAADMTLPPPHSNDKLSVMQALSQRKSSRNFVDEALSPVQLSKILWAANGLNRENGKRTIPVALGVYSVEVYAVTSEGIFLYDAEN
ncbi:MAG: nitroreductase family protein, partial [Selenomonadaceae bacterium]|nr:nitroreductase family protein [Selenomonadaceae bacterium]